MKKYMKKYIILLGIMMLAVMISAPLSRAQMAIRDNVESLLQRNEELLRTAHELVAETNSAKARTILQSGSNLQREAKSMFLLAEENYRQGKEVMARQMMGKARETAVAARDAILRAITVAKREAMTEETARKRLEHAIERHDRARSLLEESSGPESATARKLIEESRTNLDRSRDNLREHMYDVALRLADLSLSLSNQAINTLNRANGSQETVAREIRKTQRLINQIQDRNEYHADAQADKNFTEARNLQERAIRNSNSQRFQAALEFTQQARNRALRTMKILSSRTTRENVEQAITFSDGLLEKAEEMAGARDQNESRKRITEARSVQERAKESFARGEYDDALRFTQRARSLIREMINQMDSPLDPEEVESTLLQTDQMIERLRNDDGLKENATAQELLQKAEQHQAKARDALHQSSLKAALAHTKLARNLVNKALEKSHNGRM